MTKPETFTKFGKFLISGKELSGELRVASKDSRLYVRDDDEFDPYVPSNGRVTGMLHDLVKVTLIDCINLTGLGHGSRNNETYHYVGFFPISSLRVGGIYQSMRGSSPKLHFNSKMAQTCFMTLTLLGV
jgi:hypothetical protein